MINIMQIIGIIIVVALVIGLCIFFPTWVNFRHKGLYGQSGWAIILAILQGIGLYWLFFESGRGRGGYVVSLLFTVGCYLLALHYCYRQARRLQVKTWDMILSIAAQLMAPVAFPAYLIAMLCVTIKVYRKR